MPDDQIEVADEFLTAFSAASQQMKRASAAMLLCSKKATTADAQKQYDRIHKEMVMLTRLWNKLEQKRERH
jgi:hypothetical protein